MRTHMFASVLCATLCASASLQAATLTHTFDVSGLPSQGGFFDNFPTLSFDFGEPGEITLIDFDLNYEAFDPSWQSEAIVFVDGQADGGGDFDVLDPSLYGAADDPGVFAYADSYVPFGIGSGTPFITSTGFVGITLAETFTDAINPNAVYGDNSFITVTFETAAIPEPSTFVMLGLGAIVAGVVARRRLA